MTTKMFWLAVLLACAPVIADAQSPSRVVIRRVDTLVQAGSTKLDSPAEVLLAGPQLYVLNAGKEIDVFDAAGRFLRTQGRDGAGPGELRQARAMATVRKQLWVLNAGNSRVEVYDNAGKPLPSGTLPPKVLNGSAAIGPDGSFLVNMSGRDTARAELLSSTGGVVKRFASVIGPPPPFNMAAMKQEIAKGRVPAMMLVQALPVQGADGSLWLVGVGDGTVTRYERSGAIRWTTSFDSLAEVAGIRRAFFEDNRDEANPNKLVMLDRVAAVRAHGSDLYMLLRMPEDAPARIVVLNGNGRIRTVYEVPGATGIRSFDVSPDGQLLYLLDYYGDALLKAVVPR